MLKLYKLSEESKCYWETWGNGNSHTVHWGVLGTTGESKELESPDRDKVREFIQEEVDQKIAEGYQVVDAEDHFILLIEYEVVGMGTVQDVEKRHRLQERMDETLGWTGLGNCDGGSIGSGTMEVCCFVVDYEIAQKVIEEDLTGTEFENFTRIYDENK